MIPRLLPSSSRVVFFSAAILLLLAACQTAAPPRESGPERSPGTVYIHPPEERTETIEPEDVRAPEADRETLPERDGEDEERGVATADIPEREEPEEPEEPEKPAVPPEPDAAMEDGNVVPPSWQPPKHEASPTPHWITTRRLSRWIESRPMEIHYRPAGGEETVRRRIVQSLLDAGGVFYGGPDWATAEDAPADGPPAAGNVLVITITERFLETPAPRNYYAAAELEAGIYLSGWDEKLYRVAVSGPTVFSSLSHHDAALNSLYRVNPRSLQNAIVELRRRAADEIGRRGLVYHIYIDRTGDAAVQYAVLRSIGIPGESDNIWYIPRPPEEAERYIVGALEGGPYLFEMDHEARLGYFTVEEER